MAGGKDIYIGEMLEGMEASMLSLERVMTEGVDKQIERLDEVAAVLTNIAANTGITLKQTAFSGDTLTALTLNTPAVKDITLKSSSASKNTVSITHTTKNSVSATHYIDLTDYKRFTGNVRTTRISSTKISISINDVSVYTYTFASGQTDTNVPFDIDISSYNGICKITFTASASSGATSTFNVTTAANTLKLLNDDTSYNLFESCDTLVFADNVLKMSSNDYGYAYGYINFTASITDTIALWSSLIFNGAIENIRLSLLDSEGLEIKSLSTINNISDVAIYDFYIKFEFTDPEAYVSGVVFRYS